MRKVTLISEWRDNHGNRALIEEVEIKPHKEAKLEKAYRLSCYAEYDDDFCYYTAIFYSVDSAESQLEGFSCGSFRNESITRAENIIYRLGSKYKNFIDMNKNDIEKIKNCNVLNEKEKSEIIDILEKTGKVYIGTSLLLPTIDEAKILYVYLRR